MWLYTYIFRKMIVYTCSGNVVVYIHIQENDCIYMFRECDYI